MADWWDLPPGTKVPEKDLIGAQPSIYDEEMVAVVYPNGTAGTVPRSQLNEAILGKGAKLESAQATETRAERAQQEGRAGQTFIERAASVGTLGVSDLIARGMNPEEAHKMAVRSEVNPGAALAGDVFGAVTTGGASLAAAGGRAVGGAAAAKLGTGTLGRRVLGKTAGMAGEGAIFGGGAGLSHAALSDDPLTWEGAAASIGSEALLGGGIGAAFGSTGALLGEGAKAAKGMARREMEKITAKQAGAAERSAFPEFSKMDDATAAAAEEAETVAVKARKAEAIAQGNTAYQAELDRIAAEKLAGSEQYFQNAKSYKNIMKSDRSFIKGFDPETTAQIAGSAKKLKKGLNNKTGILDTQGKKGSFQTGLEEQDTVFQKILDEDAPNIRAQAAEEVTGVLETLPKRKLPQPDLLDPLAPKVMDLSARDLQRAGLFEMPSVSRAYKPRLGAKPDPIRVLMDGEGKLFIESGGAELRQALKHSADEPLSVEIGRAVDGFDAAAGDTVVLGKPGVYLDPVQADMYRAYKGRLGRSKALTITEKQLDDFTDALASGQVKPHGVQQVEHVEELLGINRQLQRDLKGLQAKPHSEQLGNIKTHLDQVKADATPTPRLDAIRAHRADLRKKSIGHHVFSAVGGSLGGMLGSAVAGPVAGGIAGAYLGRELGVRIYDRVVRKIVSGNAARGESIKLAVAQLFEKGATKAAKAIPHASKIMPAVQYNSRENVNAILGPSKYKPSKDPTVNAFRERARELDSLTEPGPNRTFLMRMHAKEEMHKQMSLVWRFNPDMANAIEKQQIVANEYMASKLPRNPAPPHLEVGKDTWEPTQAQVAQFARLMQIREKPEMCVKRLGEGTATPDDVDALKTMWPSHYEDVKRQCMERIPLLQSTMPYNKRLSLSILLDIPVDPALTQPALSVYQGPKPSGQEEGQQAQPPSFKPLPMDMVQPTAAQRMSSK